MLQCKYLPFMYTLLNRSHQRLDIYIHKRIWRLVWHGSIDPLWSYTNEKPTSLNAIRGCSSLASFPIPTGILVFEQGGRLFAADGFCVNMSICSAGPWECLKFHPGYKLQSGSILVEYLARIWGSYWISFNRHASPRCSIKCLHGKSIADMDTSEDMDTKIC